MEKSQESLRLRIYEVYAWGMPIIITSVAAILDNLPESPNDAFLRPRFGENKCWFYGEFLISFINLISFSIRRKTSKTVYIQKKKSCVKETKRNQVINTPFSL